MGSGRDTSAAEQARLERTQIQGNSGNPLPDQASVAQEPDYMKELFRELLIERMAFSGSFNHPNHQKTSRKAIVEKVVEDWYRRIENAPLGRFLWLFYRALDQADEAFAALNGTAFTERRCCTPRC